jgi:BASS family bile acid:Na+ symporter
MNPMTESHLNTLGNLLVVLFVVTNMLSLGMSMSIKEIVAPLRDVALTLKALIANFVLVPLGAYLLARLLQLEHEATIGFILIATAAGEPFVTKLGQLSKADPAYILALLVMLQVVSVVYMPVMLPLLLPGVTVSPWDIAKPLIFLMLVPLAIGLGVKLRLLLGRSTASQQGDARTGDGNARRLSGPRRGRQQFSHGAQRGPHDPHGPPVWNANHGAPCRNGPAP